MVVRIGEIWETRLQHITRKNEVDSSSLLDLKRSYEQAPVGSELREFLVHICICVSGQKSRD